MERTGVVGLWVCGGMLSDWGNFWNHLPLSQVGCGGGGITMAGKEWLGPRDWSPEEYGPGAKCIDARFGFG